MFIKIGVMLQAVQLIICDPKSKIDGNFWTAIPRNKRNMLIAILLIFFITYFANFIWELPNSVQAETYSEPYQRFKIKFLVKIGNSSRWVFRTESNIYDEAFWEKHFQPSTISAVRYLQKKLHLRLSTPFWICLWNY